MCVSSPNPVLLPYPTQVSTIGAGFCSGWLKTKPFSRIVENGEALKRILSSLSASLGADLDLVGQRGLCWSFKERLQQVLADETALSVDLSSLCKPQGIPELTEVANALKENIVARQWVISDLENSLVDLLQQQASFSVLRIQYLDPIASNTDEIRQALIHLGQGLNTPLDKLRQAACKTKNWKKGGKFATVDSLFKEAIELYLDSCQWYYSEVQGHRKKSWGDMNRLIGIAARTPQHLLGQSKASDTLCKSLLDRESQLLAKVESSVVLDPLRSVCLEDSRLRCLTALRTNYESHHLAKLPTGDFAQFCENWQANYPETPLLPLCKSVQELVSAINPWDQAPHEPELFESYLQIWTTNLQIQSDLALPKLVAEALKNGELSNEL